MRPFDVVKTGRRDARWTESMDAPVRFDEPDGQNQIDLLPSEEAGYGRVEANHVCSTAGLDEREWQILRMRFGEEMTQTEIAKKIGISQMQASRVSRRALAKLLGAVQGKDQPASLVA